MALHNLPTLRDLIEVVREGAIEALGGVTAAEATERQRVTASALRRYYQAKGRAIEAERDRDRMVMERDTLARTNAELKAALDQQLEKPTIALSTAFLENVVAILEGHDYPDTARTLRDALKGGA